MDGRLRPARAARTSVSGTSGSHAIEHGSARLRRLLAAVGLLFRWRCGLVAAADAPPAGPPFPQPEVDRAVYDFAGILSPAAIASAEAMIDTIEARTGAEVVVYTQDSGEYPTTEETRHKALALMDQWGVGRERASTTAS